jgi:hypothetical protein
VRWVTASFSLGAAPIKTLDDHPVELPTRRSAPTAAGV